MNGMSLRTRAAAYFEHLMKDRPASWLDKAALHVLGLGACIYEAAVTGAYRSYERGSKPVTHLGAKVISLGNITVGGTGKTPMACYLARRLNQCGYSVALLNRGYQSQKEHGMAVMSDGKDILLTPVEGGDEACLMARKLPGIPVLVGRERAASGQLAIDKFGTRVLILDDAFQHWRLYRDLDIVLIDATNPFGNGHVLPRGILREPLPQLKRAGLFLLTKTEGQQVDVLASISRVLRQYNPTAPIAQSSQSACWCIPFETWMHYGTTDWHMPAHVGDMRVIAVSALGNPASFEHTVQAAGFQLVQTMRFDDHHQYTAGDVQTMAQRAAAEQAVIITTEKDAIKFPEQAVRQYCVPVWILGIEIEITSGAAEMETLLRSVLGG
jgi:tetraacyldisaccharide 4'-kinase